MAARWGYFEDTVRLAAALRPALAARGVPARIYTDNGSAFVDAAVNRAAARLGIKITHSAPGRPEGRGKIERFFRTVREEFLVEIGDGSGVRGPGGAEPAVHRLVRARLPRPAAFGDRAAADASGGWPGRRSRSRIPPGCGRRSCGPSTGSSARTPRSACSVSFTRSATCPWPAGRSSASSTRSTCRCWRSAGTGGRTAPRSRRRPGGTPTRRRSRRSRTSRRRPTGIDYLGLIRAEHEEAARRDRIRYDALAAGEDGQDQDTAEGGR